MATRLAKTALENSTYVVNVAFKDEDGAAEIPTALTWTLTDETGAIVNARSDVAVAVPAASVDIALTGADLALSTYAGLERVLTVEATYTSALGAGMTLKDECWFSIEPLVAVP